MRVIGIVLCGIIALTCGPAFVEATGCHAVRVVRHNYVSPVYHHQAAISYYQPYVPYTIGYAPSGNADLEKEVLRLRVEVLQLQVQQLKTPPQQQQTGPQQPEVLPIKQSAAAGIFAAKCASCHSETTAQAKGRGFVLLKGGSFAHLTALEKLETIRQTRLGKMPKGGTALSDQEYSAIVAELSGP